MDRILVRDSQGYNEINAATVHEDAALEEVLAHLVHNAGLCSVFVVGSRGLFSGVITRTILMRSARCPYE